MARPARHDSTGKRRSHGAEPEQGEPQPVDRAHRNPAPQPVGGQAHQPDTSKQAYRITLAKGGTRSQQQRIE